MEPAVRHSVVAVGSLYEQVHGHRDSSSLPADENVALTHYNSAIKHLKTMDNESLVLLVCILFVCIEFLRGNRAAATAHCQHGITILKRVEETFPWVKTYLSPLFRRLSILPFFFFAAADYLEPNLLCLDDTIPSFHTYGDAQYFLDGILSRTVRLIRRGDVYRLGCLKHKPVSPDLIVEQSHTRTLLDEWHLSFTNMISKSHDQLSPPVQQCNMLIRYLISRVWVETAFEFEQTIYDKYNHVFRSVVDLAATANASDYGAKPIKFTFEMGFIPVLYFATIKCRCLKTRLRALSLMKSLGASRENLWDLVTMFISAKRIIEIEHGATLTDDGRLSDEPSCPGLPPDAVRVRDSSTESKPLMETVDGVEMEGRLGGFFLQNAEGDVYVRTEFLPIPSWA